LKNLWLEPTRYYLDADHEQLPHFDALLGPLNLTTVASSGGKAVLTNHPLATSGG
jgi:hypothetical protein